MPLSDSRWHQFTPSAYPWEREALAFVRDRLPDHEPYRAWGNFEFVADDGKIHEVDLLVLSPKGFFLVEIKSRPGTLAGDAHTWTWSTDGRRISCDNPRLLADRKAKRLKSLLARQRSARKIAFPFVLPVVFCSAPDLVLQLEPAGRHGVFLRDHDGRDGIVAALTRWAPGGADDPGERRIDRPTAKAIARAIEEAGIRPSQRSRRVADYLLRELLDEAPTWQDWSADHASIAGVRRRVRIYTLPLGASEPVRQQIVHAAEREFRILQGIRHPNILGAQDYHQHERGPALLFDFDRDAVRFDHFLRDRGAVLSVDQRLALIRQVGEALRYAHEKKLVHRGLSPQSILVADPDAAVPHLQIINWQTGTRDSAARTTGGSSMTTLAADLFLDEAALVYTAPEVLSGQGRAGEHADVFSLGAIAFHLFAGRPPAASVLQRDEMLRTASGLDLAAAVDGVGPELRDLVRWATAPDLSQRLDSIGDVLDLLERVEEELTTPDEEPIADPTEARVGDRLRGGLVVGKRLGRGSTAVTFLVAHDGIESVLKVAAEPGHNDVLRAEADALGKLRHARIVEFRRVLDIGDRVGILMAPAGNKTLAQRLRDDGRLHVELLQRFGEELLQAVDHLEDVGIAHRDIKPENIGITQGTARDMLHVVLFDFSLARTPAENIRAGTRPYLDPFLALRQPPRWDVYAERFAATVTLYEMATATLPRWGDGLSDPAVIDAEVTIEPDLFEAELREPLGRFFSRALRRNVRERFDTCEEMLRAWRHVFEIDTPRADEDEEAARTELASVVAAATAETRIAALPVSTRVRTAMDRFGIDTVGGLLRMPLMRIHGMRGVGNKTRREITELVDQLAACVPLPPEPASMVAEAGIPWPGDRCSRSNDAGVLGDEDIEPNVHDASLDLLGNRLLPAARGQNASERRVLALLLGLERDPALVPWPSQSEVAVACNLTRARIGQILQKARERWAKQSLFTALREDVAAHLDQLGGVCSAAELAAALLARGGSARRDPEGRAQVARSVARAAIEGEKILATPRFLLRRGEHALLVAISFEFADYAQRLGAGADDLAAADPLPSSAHVREQLQRIKAPADAQIDPTRLVHLAAAASAAAAVSSRLELYPRGMAAARAIKLAHGVLLGSRELTVEDVQERVRSRYPLAEPLPGHPELDALLLDAGWEFRWSSDAAAGRGAYCAPSVFGPASETSQLTLRRYGTSLAPVESTPEVLEAEQFEQRLTRSLGDGSFLALTVRPKELGGVEMELTRRFPVAKRSLERLMVEAMRAVAAERNVDWTVVLAADATDPTSRDWGNLLLLVRAAMPRLQAALTLADTTLLLTHPGLLARYDQLGLIDFLHQRVATKDGLPGVWLLIPSDDQKTLPVIDGEAVPVITPGQWARIPDSWIRNLHRGGHGLGLKE